MSVRFEEPAHHALRSAESLTEFTTALRARPGRWALLGQYGTPGVASTVAYDIRKGLMPAFAGGGFEAEARSMLGEYRVYVRYVGQAGGAR
jgi:hypothetical protein